MRSLCIGFLWVASLLLAASKLLGAGQYTLLESDARSSGSAGLGLGEAESLDLFSAPVRLGRLEKPGVAASHLSWIEGMRLDSLAFAAPWGRGAVGLGLSYMQLDAFDSTGGADDAFGFGQTSFRAGYARTWGGTRRLLAGLALAADLPNGSLAGEGGGLGLDVGLGLQRLMGRLSLGASLRGLSARPESARPPTELALDAALVLTQWLSAGLRQSYSGGLNETGIGLEAALGKALRLRAGWLAPNSGDRQEWTAGVGFRLGDSLRVDLAARPLGPLGNALWASVALDFVGGPDRAMNSPVEAVEQVSVKKETPAVQATAPSRGAPRSQEPSQQSQGSAVAWADGDFELTATLEAGAVSLRWPVFADSLYRVQLAMVEGGSFRPVAGPFGEAVYEHPLVLRGALYYFRVLVLSADGGQRARSRVKVVTLAGGPHE